MMCWSIPKARHAFVHPRSIFLEPVSVEAIADESPSNDDFKPEVTVPHVFEASIVVHWLSWHRPLEVSLIGAHEMLELDGVLARDAMLVSVLEVEEVVQIRGVELARATERFAADGTSIRLRHTAIVVA